MFCPVCGKELETNARFCPECGATIIGSTPTPYVKETEKTVHAPKSPIPKQSSHPSRPSRSKQPHHHSHRKRRGLTIGLIIGMLLLAGGGIFGIVMAVNWGSIEGYNYYYYDNPTPSAVEAFQFDVDVADVDIGYNSSPTSHLIEIIYHYHASGGFLDGKSFEDIYEVTWENTSATVFFKSQFKWWTNWVFTDRSVISVILRSDIVYSIDGDVSTGDVDFTMLDNTNVSTFAVTDSTGDITLTIGNGTKFQESFSAAVSTGSITIYGDDIEFQKTFTVTASTGDIDITGELVRFKDDLYAETSTGTITFTFIKPEFSDKIELYASTGDIVVYVDEPEYNTAESLWIGDISTGSFTLGIKQSNPMGANITANIEASTGDIIIDMDIDLSIGAQFISSVGIGDYSYSNRGGFEILGSVFQTTTYPRTSNYEFSLSVSTGNIDVMGLCS